MTDQRTEHKTTPETNYTGPHADLYQQAATDVMERTGKDLIVKGGAFLNVDGTTFIMADRSDEYKSYRTIEEGRGGERSRRLETEIAPHNGSYLPMDGGMHYYRNELVGKYGTINSLIQYVDAYGRMQVGFATEENERALKEAGYERFSNFPVSLGMAEPKFVGVSGRFTTEEKAKIVEDLNREYQEMLKRGFEKAEQERKAAKQNIWYEETT